jgi:paraquat-inducible protein A
MIIACSDCGTIQRLPPLHRGSRLRCRLCAKVLERTAGRSLDAALALSCATLLLWIPANLGILLNMQVLGIDRSSRLVSGILDLWREGWLALAIIVGLQGVVLPFFRFGLLTASLASIRFRFQRRWTAIAFRWSEHLDDWSMPDVFLFGAAIGYSRVAVFVPVTIGIGGWSLIAVACLTMITRASIDRVSIWRQIHRPDSPEAGPRIACTQCDLVLPARFLGCRCPRCAARLWRRKPFAIMEATALVLAAYPLYLVANWFPMSVQDVFGKASEQTIIYGVAMLISAGFWPLAGIIFLASIFIPLAKLVGMSWLLWSAHRGSNHHLILKTRLYRFIEAVGRWSNVDIFTIVIFLPIMQIAGLVSVRAGNGAPAFLAVIVLTMLAVRLFDPRLLWDHLESDR